MKTARQVEKEKAKYAKHQADLSRLSELLAGIPDKPISAGKESGTPTPANTPRNSHKQ